MAGFAARTSSWFDRYNSLKGRVERIKEKGEEAIGQGLQLVEVGGTAFGFSYLNARNGKPDPKHPGILRLQVMGVDADLGAAFGLHVLAFLGGAGKYGEHAHNIADGAAASYLSRLGTELGSDARTKAAQKTGGAQITGGSQITGGLEVTGAERVNQYVR